MGTNHPRYEAEYDRIFTEKPGAGDGDVMAHSNFIPGTGVVGVGAGGNSRTTP